MCIRDRVSTQSTWGKDIKIQEILTKMKVILSLLLIISLASAAQYKFVGYTPLDPLGCLNMFKDGMKQVIGLYHYVRLISIFPKPAHASKLNQSYDKINNFLGDWKARCTADPNGPFAVNHPNPSCPDVQPWREDWERVQLIPDFLPLLKSSVKVLPKVIEGMKHTATQCHINQNPAPLPANAIYELTVFPGISPKGDEKTFLEKPCEARLNEVKSLASSFDGCNSAKSTQDNLIKKNELLVDECLHALLWLDLKTPPKENQRARCIALVTNHFGQSQLFLRLADKCQANEKETKSLSNKIAKQIETALHDCKAQNLHLRVL
eukprot:TRINITY_DN52_c0_g1_i1.p1 TRINITY_DN52_c0_g1~~TRINITY_DN52_c0_g1_i1.p1  ORF type:complete len:322 (-),score=104.16 TRINITY_DN52_c0_g1_i1:253-1218(-)